METRGSMKNRSNKINILDGGTGSSFVSEIIENDCKKKAQNTR